jgi:hypothetical protein
MGPPAAREFAVSEVWKTTIPDLILGQVVKRDKICEVSVSRHKTEHGEWISVQFNGRDMAFDLETGQHRGSGTSLYWKPSRDWNEFLTGNTPTAEPEGGPPVQ